MKELPDNEISQAYKKKYNIIRNFALFVAIL